MSDSFHDSLLAASMFLLVPALWLLVDKLQFTRKICKSMAKWLFTITQNAKKKKKKKKILKHTEIEPKHEPIFSKRTLSNSFINYYNKMTIN